MFETDGSNGLGPQNGEVLQDVFGVTGHAPGLVCGDLEKVEISLL